MFNSQTSVTGAINGKALSADAQRRIHDALKETLEAELKSEVQARPAWHGSTHGSTHGTVSFE